MSCSRSSRTIDEGSLVPCHTFAASVMTVSSIQCTSAPTSRNRTAASMIGRENSTQVNPVDPVDIAEHDDECRVDAELEQCEPSGGALRALAPHAECVGEHEHRDGGDRHRQRDGLAPTSCDMVRADRVLRSDEDGDQHPDPLDTVAADPVPAARSGTIVVRS